MEQLPLDFSVSSAQRHRRAKKRLETAAAALDRPSLFDEPPNIDVHLLSATEAVASISGSAPERTRVWLERIVGQTRQIKGRRVAFPAAKLPELAWVRPPAHVTLDAPAQAVVRALWARKLGLKPLRVSRSGQRLRAASPAKWPAGMAITDAPWSAIVVLVALDVPLDVDWRARRLMLDKLAASDVVVARAGLAGSAVHLTTSRPALLEAMELPALAYVGGPDSGRYQLPLLAAEPLLRTPQVKLSRDVTEAIRRASSPTRPLRPVKDFPWTLFDFQARDAGRAIRILEVTGGVLLAGDMGSGKTTVSLALVNELDLWPLLVIAPLSAFSTWDRQLSEMGVSAYLATASQKQTWEDLAANTYDVVVISYDRLHAFTELVERKGFRSIIADEVQRIRTPGSRRSRALRQLAASVPYRIGLSGTPLTNTIADLLPLGAFLVPGEWKPRANSKELEDLYPGDPVEAIAEHLGSMMVRRRMADVGTKLPRRNDHRVFIDLEPEQRRALHDLEEEARQAKEDGAFDDPTSKIHAFARLQQMRKIVNAPSSAGLNCPNPKVRAALDLTQDMLAMGRKGVIFCADRTTFRELGVALDEAGIGWVGIWGSTPPLERIAAEKRFHTDPDVKVVVCTIQAGSESWSASPTATWLISTAYMYAPATLSQMEARVYRMNSDPDGPEIEIFYLHAQMPGGSLDDRMVEILEIKKHLFAQVVDRTAHVDATKVHYSMGDLVFLMTGRRDEALDRAEADRAATVQREQDKKRLARATAHRHKGKNRSDADLIHDTGEQAMTREEHQRTYRRSAPAGAQTAADVIFDEDLFEDPMFEDGYEGDFDSDALDAEE